MPCQFRTRTRGTVRQIGQKFPVFEKKKLPPKIAVKSRRPRIRGHQITDMEYTPPTEDKPGKISFKFDGKQISNYIQLVDRNANVGNFDVFKNTVYIDNTVAHKYIQSLALHESLERYFRELGLNEFGPGHLLAEDLEKQAFLKSGHDQKEWENYSKLVEFVHRIASGGKISDLKLERAYALLAQRQRQLKWQSRGLDSIVQKQTEAREQKAFGKDLKKIIDRKLREE